MRRAVLVFGLTALVGCAALLGLDDHDPPESTELSDAGPADAPLTDARVSSDTSTALVDAALPECAAQRVIHIVGGNGGLGWFTLIWPAPTLVASPGTTPAYDDFSKQGPVAGTSAAHPLFARKVGTRTVLQGIGAHPNPSVFVAGYNETHTDQPRSTIVLSTGTEIIAAGAVLQKKLAPKIPVLELSPAGPFGPVSGQDSSLPPFSNNVDASVYALPTTYGLSVAEAESMRPDLATLAAWGIGPETRSTVTFLAQDMLFAARGFQHGYLGSIIIPAFLDDPEGAFADVGSTTLVVDALARVLEGFYTELAKVNEPSCTHNGAPLSLADNVLMIITGDTPHDAFNANGWPDGSPQNSNFIYVRSNGFLTPGWFGAIAPSMRTDFDPRTGDLLPAGSSSATTVTNATNSALGGVLYAITRGNKGYVGDIGPGPYQASLAASPP